MKTSDFNFDLPEELIAQTPLERRDASRLLTLDKRTGQTGHHHFYDIADMLNPGDCLVLNNSRVLPARLIGRRETGGACEVLLLIDRGENVWECLVRPGRKLKPGIKVVFGEGELIGEIVAEVEGGNRLVHFSYEGIFLEVLERLGRMPLPPYIKAELQDQERYQTVYSREVGSAAAPTAGLHWTKELLEKARAKGVKTAFVTLHVGLGTFRPVKAENILEHHMHSELCMMSAETAAVLNETKANGGRVICVGTTSCRTLESLVNEDGSFEWIKGYEDNTLNTDNPYNYEALLEDIDIVVMGKRCYEQDMHLEFKAKTVYVVTHSTITDYDNIKFCGEDIIEVIKEEQRKPGKDIMLFGGGKLINTFFI